MPNWCNNSVTLRHADPREIIKAREGFEKGELLNTFIPCPQILRDTMAGSYPASMVEEKAALELQEAENIRLHGHKNWYEWCVDHWGTKWDIGDADGITSFGNNELMVYFDSAWAPPTEAYGRLMDMGFEIEAYYYEPGMAFCGSWINGIDTEYQIPSTSDEAEKVIPHAIDEMFAITESMAEWEDEDENYEASGE